MKTYKIIPHTAMFICAFICVILAAVSIYIPKEVFESSLGKDSAVIIFLLSILSLLFSIIFGKIEEIKQGEYLDGE